MPFDISNDQTIKGMSISRFVIYFILFIAFLAFAPLLAQYYFPDEDLIIPRFWPLFWIFSIVTFSIYLFAYWRMGISNKDSGQALLGSVTIKLLICMIIAFIYISGNTVEPVKFIINFFYLYFFHTVFEIYCLLCNLRNQKFK